MKFPAIYLLHGHGGSPHGSVLLFETELRKYCPTQHYVRPSLPHSDRNALPWSSLLYLRELAIPNGALLIGISLGGLLAAKLQEFGRPDLHAICISAPTHVAETALHMRMPQRVALYSSSDPVIKGRTESWPSLALAYDLPWLTHDTDQHIGVLAAFVHEYVTSGELRID